MKGFSIFLVLLVSACVSLPHCGTPFVEVSEVNVVRDTTVVVRGMARGATKVEAIYFINRPGAIQKSQRADLRGGVAIAELENLLPNMSYRVFFLGTNECPGKPPQSKSRELAFRTDPAINRNKK